MYWPIISTALNWVGPITYMGIYRNEILPIWKMAVVAAINAAVVAVINLALGQSPFTPFIWGVVTLLAMIVTNWFRIGEQRDAARYAEMNRVEEVEEEKEVRKIFRD